MNVALGWRLQTTAKRGVPHRHPSIKPERGVSMLGSAADWLLRSLTVILPSFQVVLFPKNICSRPADPGPCKNVKTSRS